MTIANLIWHMESETGQWGKELETETRRYGPGNSPWR